HLGLSLAGRGWGGAAAMDTRASAPRAHTIHLSFLDPAIRPGPGGRQARRRPVPHPAHRPRNAPRGRCGPPRDARSHLMARILVVDDHALNRTFLRSLLAHYGHEIAEAADGEDALRILREKSQDLVISD